MKNVFLIAATSLIAGYIVLSPSKVLAQFTMPNHHTSHDFRRQQDHNRHEVGISRQQDRAIHRQEKSQHRMEHRLSNGYYYQSAGSGGALVNLLNGWYNINGYPTGTVGPGSGGNLNGYYNGVNSGYDGVAVQDGHAYTADGHRFDHHGNHDDAAGNL